MSQYLTSVEERARRAQLKAAEEAVKAQEERKRRKLTGLLAAAVLLIVVGGQARIQRLQEELATFRDRLDAIPSLQHHLLHGGRLPSHSNLVLHGQIVEHHFRNNFV